MIGFIRRRKCSRNLTRKLYLHLSTLRRLQHNKRPQQPHQPPQQVPILLGPWIVWIEIPNQILHRDCYHKLNHFSQKQFAQI